MNFNDFLDAIEKVDRKYQLDVQTFAGRARVVSYVKEAWNQRNLSISVDYRNLQDEEEVHRAIAPLLERIVGRYAEALQREAERQRRHAELAEKESQMTQHLRIAANGDPSVPVRLKILDSGNVRAGLLSLDAANVIRLRENTRLPEDPAERAKLIVKLDQLISDFFKKAE